VKRGRGEDTLKYPWSIAEELIRCSFPAATLSTSWPAVEPGPARAWCFDQAHVEALNIRRDRRRSLNLTKSQNWRDQ
jgi:hypothetical protein